MEKNHLEIGIDDLNLYGSTLAVEAGAINAARGAPAGSAEQIKLARRSLAPAFEDPITLAANAAYPLVEAYGRDAFELLVVATESGVDYAKPVGSYVHRYLGLMEQSFHVEMKHACFAATAGLELSSAWVRANPDKRALVIATDMARKLFHDSAEPAEGAGSVAMVVSAAPRVLAFGPHRGRAAREVYDVMRPDPVRETIHADLSLAAYLDLCEIAWDGYRSVVGPRAFEQLDYMAFHTPVIPLVEQAHQLLAGMNDLRESPRVVEHFERCVFPSFAYTRELGNIYSGSLYTALAGLIDTAPELRAGATVGLYSYGSGSCASYFSGTVGADARATLGRHRIAAHLAERRVVDIPAYERTVLANERALTEANFTPDRDLVPGHFEAAYQGRHRLVLESIRDFYRSYAWT